MRRNQAVAGIESAEIQEIIDHHRLGTVQTMSPVFFRNQPLGCTATIIYQMYQEAGVEIDKTIAGLLCSAIISDTLLFRSPTCTAVDEAAARALAGIAGLDIESYAMRMFSAGSNLKDKTDEEIFYQDFKRFTAGKAMIGVGQITSLNAEELRSLRERMVAFMHGAGERNGLDMVFFMLTNILTETTELVCQGQGALQLAARAFHQDTEEDPGTGAYAAGCGVPQKAADSGADAGGAGVKAADAGMRFRRKCDEQGILEAGQYALSGACGDGELRPEGREAEYYYGGLGGNRLLGSAYGLHLRPQKSGILMK